MTQIHNITKDLVESIIEELAEDATLDKDYHGEWYLYFYQTTEDFAKSDKVKQYALEEIWMKLEIDEDEDSEEAIEAKFNEVWETIEVAEIAQKEIEWQLGNMDRGTYL